jgi:dipeptidyl aminopeptidase/acylaminoacyl peptidase
MNIAPSLLLIALALNCVMVSSAPAQASPKSVEIVKGVLFSEIPAGDGRPKIWLYTPNPVPTKPVPAIFIAPAGSGSIFGQSLGEGSQAEHIPYAAAGYIVVAYELSGAVERQGASDQALQVAFARFSAAEAGMKDLAAALDYAAWIKVIDPDRMIAAGHSSAGAVSLVAAALEPRIKACIAYAPVTNLPAKFGAPTLRRFEPVLRGVTQFCTDYSPHTLAPKIKVPTFLLAVEDDRTVPYNVLKAFADSLQATNPNVTLKTIKQGNHYESMIQEGIPAALQWLKSLSL